MRYLLLIINLMCASAVVLAAEADSYDYTRHELKSATERHLRLQQERTRRLQSNELLDDNSLFYYDGRSFYPGMVINELIFPAVLEGTVRRPGCIYEGRVIPGSYQRQDKFVLCQLLNEPQYGKSITLTGSGQPQLQPFIAEAAPAATAASRLIDPTPAAADAAGGGSLPKVADAATASKSAAAALPPAVAQTSHSASAVGSSTVAVPQVSPNFSAAKTGQQLVLEVNGFRAVTRYGVRAGTWARVLLPRQVSSSEISQIELQLLEDLPGLHRSVPAGTLFFANHQVNPYSQRLDLQVTMMVLPDGSELSVSGSIHGLSKTAGLAGVVVTHTDKVALLATRRALLDSAAEGIGLLTAPAANLAGNVATEVVSAQQRAVPYTPDFMVQVGAQEALLRFGRSF